jgi:hypothetical protein
VITLNVINRDVYFIKLLSLLAGREKENESSENFWSVSRTPSKNNSGKATRGA